jgi:hypothetical protein
MRSGIRGRAAGSRNQPKPDHVRWLVLILVMALGLVGYYGPWVPHKAAGLIVVGLDLAEYVKFIPEVASGQIRLYREIFYLPLFAASVAATIIASRDSLPRWVRVPLALIAIPLALAMLPPAWSPAVLRMAEFRLQVSAIAFCLLLVPATAVLRHMPDRLALVILALISLAAAVPPAWGFLLVHGAIEGLYRRPLPLGWGLWLQTLGFLACAFVSTAEAFRRQ